jgi:hypothetical protein
MYPFINRELILAREAELRSRAERDRRVNVAISDRRTRRFWRARWGSRRPLRPVTARST